MANKYYSISVSTPSDDLLNALISRYGSENIVTYYNSSGILIFSCPIISDKVIKIRMTSSYVEFYYGTAWLSGATISNSVQFINSNLNNIMRMHLILGEKFFLLSSDVANAAYAYVALIGKMTNEKYIAVGCLGGNSPLTIGRNTTDSMDISFCLMSRPFVNINNKLYKQDLILTRSDGRAEWNTDGSLATVLGVYNVSYVNGSLSSYVDSTKFMSNTGLYSSNTTPTLQTSLYCELS